MKNSRIFATSVVWSLMLIESVMSGSVVKEVSVWTNRVMETGFEVREADDHILLFVFDFDNDAERVLATEPWVFDKHLVLF